MDLVFQKELTQKIHAARPEKSGPSADRRELPKITSSPLLPT
jgi:hypothetical protein